MTYPPFIQSTKAFSTRAIFSAIEPLYLVAKNENYVAYDLAKKARSLHYRA
jgi:hypothetical protein